MDESLSVIPNEIGKRIRILYTDDRYTKLRKGYEGTISRYLLLPEGRRQKVMAGRY